MTEEPYTKEYIQNALNCCSEEILKLREIVFDQWNSKKKIKSEDTRVFVFVKESYLNSITQHICHKDPFEVLDEILKNYLDAK